MDIKIRNAVREDSQAIFELITILAEYEKAPDQVDNSPEEIALDGFGEFPSFDCFIAENEQGQVIGMALYYYRYSTWKGRTLHLEDLIIRPEYRGQGVGNALFDKVMALAKEQKLRRVEWEVLRWNNPAIEFYQSKGATIDPEWHLCKMFSDDLERF